MSIIIDMMGINQYICLMWTRERLHSILDFVFENILEIFQVRIWVSIKPNLLRTQLNLYKLIHIDKLSSSFKIKFSAV